MALFAPHIITPDSALGGTQIQRSLRFDGENNNNISRTPSSTGNQKVWTWSCWFKRTKLGNGSYNYLVSSYGNNDGIAAIYFDSSDRINTYFDTSGSNPYGSVNERKYRDTASWMHIVWQVDAINTTQKIWINGVEESLSSSLNPPNFSYTMNQSGQLQTIGGAAWYPEGTGNNNYLTEIHFSDGNKYTPSDFAYTDAQTGQWRPKNGNVIKSNITYGTNGYWLDFRDNTSTTTLGYDYSGNGNHWTLNNMSVAASADNNSSEDTPTNNFCTLSPLLTDTRSDCSFTNGNLKVTTGSGASIVGTSIPKSTGKWYAEFVCTAKSSVNMGIGINSVYGFDGERQWNESQNGGYGIAYLGGDNEHSGKLMTDGGGTASYGASYTTNDVIGVALDLDKNTVNFYKNNAAQGIISLDDGHEYVMTCGEGQSGATATFDANFGQRPFTYTPPAGYRALNSKNIATPDAAGVVRPQRFFDTLLYTGNNNTSQNITGLEFQPDLVWVKNRDNVERHHLVDSVRGNNKVLFSNEADGERTGSHGNGHTQLNLAPNGFNLVSNGSNDELNFGTRTYVAWCWKAGGAAVSNGDGNITSSVSVNEEAGFSIVSYTGNGSNGQTVGHGLSQAPQWIMLKARDATQNWRVWHHKLAADGSKRLLLDASNASEDASFLNDTAPTSTVFTLGNADDAWNANSAKFIVYCWHEVPGFSKFGNYKGNGSSDGTFVYLGFRPAWLMVKKTNTANNFVIFDNKRSTTNVIDDYLAADDSAAESSTSSVNVDFLSNGFKFRSGYDIVNAGDYVYMAFAERPSETMFGLDANAR